MDLGFNLAQSNQDLKDPTSRQIFGDTSGLLCKNDLIPCHMCIGFAFQFLRAKEVRIDIEVKISEEKLCEVMTCDVSPAAMFQSPLAMHYRGSSLQIPLL